MVEYKAFAFPQAVVRGGLLQVIQDTALQVVHVFKPLFQ